MPPVRFAPDPEPAKACMRKHPTLSFHPIARAFAAAGLCAGIAAPAVADTEAQRIQTLERRLESSVQLIEKLSGRIADLERSSRPLASSAAPAAETTQAIATQQKSVAELAQGSGARSGETGLPVHGFIDVGAGWSGKRDPARMRGFNAGTLDLYLTPQFGNRVKSLIELAFEYDSEGGLAVDLERLQLGYTVSDSLTVWLGRFHTPFGIWNTWYHHGAQLQTSIFRPRMLDFEDRGGFLPDHSVGAWATGKTALGPGKITYDAYVTNGPSIRERTLQFGGLTDNDAGKLVGFNLGYEPSGALNGLVVGVHGFGSNAATYDPSGAELSKTRLRMGGAYFGYDTEQWNAIGEYYRFANTDLGDGAKHTSSAWFVQVGRSFGAWTPYARHERAALDAGDRFFASQNAGRSYRRTSLGLRYGIDPRSAVKLEVSSTRESAAVLLDENGANAPLDAASYGRVALQYSIAF